MCNYHKCRLIMYISAFFTRIWNRLHYGRADGLMIEPPQRQQHVNKKRKRSSRKPNNDGESEALKRFKDNITKIAGDITGDLEASSIITSMKMGGFRNTAVLNAMSGGGGVGSQSMNTTANVAEDNEKESSEENDQPLQAAV